MSRARSASGYVAALAGLAVIVLGILLIRAEVSWRRADALRSEGDLSAAVRSARGVFDLYVPGNPRLHDASELIWQAAKAQEAAGQRGAALDSYRILRSAWKAAHPPGGENGWTARCEEKIAGLLSGAPRDPGRYTGDSGPDGASDLLAGMRGPARPFGIWGAVAALGFAGWAAAAAGLIAWGFRRDGGITTTGFGWAGVLAISYAIWIIGMARA